VLGLGREFEGWGTIDEVLSLIKMTVVGAEKARTEEPGLLRGFGEGIDIGFDVEPAVLFGFGCVVGYVVGTLDFEGLSHLKEMEFKIRELRI
jgi:hypothetical protein